MDLKISDLPLASAITGTEYVPVVQGGTTKKTLASSLGGGGGGGGGIALTDLSATSPVLYNNTTGVFSIQVANTSQAGYLSASDWNVFNGKGDALTTGNLSQFASTTSAQFASIISDETGTGSVVFANTPTLVTPILGVASATSVTITGTGGAGYVQLPLQSSAPAAVNNAMILYSDSSNRFSFVRRNNANSADINRTLIFPDANTTITFPTPTAGGADSVAYLGTGQTYTQQNTFSNTSGQNIYKLNLRNGANSTYVAALSYGTAGSAEALIIGGGLTISFAQATSYLNDGGAGTYRQLWASNNSNTLIMGGGFSAMTFGGSSTTSMTFGGSYSIQCGVAGTGITSFVGATPVITGGSATTMLTLSTSASNSATRTADLYHVTGNNTSTGDSGWQILNVGTTVSGARGNIQLFGTGSTRLASNSMQGGIVIGNRTTSPTANLSGGTYLYANANNLETTGSFVFPLAGTGLQFKTGSNARVGTSTLASGTITVSNTSVTANTKVKVQLASVNGGVLGIHYLYTVNAGVGFTITSVDATGATVATDTAIVDWYLTEFN